MLSVIMRRIYKCTAPHSLVKAKKSCGNEWGKVPENVKDLWRKQLIKEQEGFDAYTEEILSPDEKKTTHIDHFKKRAHHPELTYDWDNLFLANHHHNNAYGADAKDNGTSKIQKDRYSDLIHPAKEDPHDYFTYNLRGEILPREGLDEAMLKRAQFTIDTLCLNSPALLQKRNGILRELKNYKNQIAEVCLDLKGCPFPSLIDCYKEEKWWTLERMR